MVSLPADLPEEREPLSSAFLVLRVFEVALCVQGPGGAGCGERRDRSGLCVVTAGPAGAERAPRAPPTGLSGARGAAWGDRLTRCPFSPFSNPNSSPCDTYCAPPLPRIPANARAGVPGGAHRSCPSRSSSAAGRSSAGSVCVALATVGSRLVESRLPQRAAGTLCCCAWPGHWLSLFLLNWNIGFAQSENTR